MRPTIRAKGLTINAAAFGIMLGGQFCFGYWFSLIDSDHSAFRAVTAAKVLILDIPWENR